MKSGEMSWEDFQRVKNGNTLYKFTVVTGSMVPIIPVGGKVVVESHARPRWGDIVVFWQDGKLICHVLWHQNRVLQSQGEQIYVTRSLVGKNWDVSIRAGQLLGVVISHRLSLWWKVRLWWRDSRRARRR